SIFVSIFAKKRSFVVICLGSSVFFAPGSHFLVSDKDKSVKLPPVLSSGLNNKAKKKGSSPHLTPAPPIACTPFFCFISQGNFVCISG
ncbi:unnamed protein product, partial [Brassica oleracea var. botrytis]